MTIIIQPLKEHALFYNGIRDGTSIVLEPLAAGDEGDSKAPMIRLTREHLEAMLVMVSGEVTEAETEPVQLAASKCYNVWEPVVETSMVRVMVSLESDGSYVCDCPDSPHCSHVQAVQKL